MHMEQFCSFQIYRDLDEFGGAMVMNGLLGFGGATSSGSWCFCGRIRRIIFVIYINFILACKGRSIYYLRVQLVVGIVDLHHFINFTLHEWPVY